MTLARILRATYEASWVALSFIAGILTWDVGLYPIAVVCALGVLLFGSLSLKFVISVDWIEKLSARDVLGYAAKAVIFGVLALGGWVVGLPLELDLVFLWTGLSAGALCYVLWTRL